MIVSLIFFFSLGGLVNALGHCFLGNDLPTESITQIPLSISCLDNQDHPFVARVDQRDKRIHFSKIENSRAVICHKASLPGETFHFTGMRPAVSILDSLSVPIYQFKNVYRI